MGDPSREFAGTTRFDAVRRLGEGASGVVYEVVDRELGARVALKTLTKLDASSRYAFKREFRSVADVAHPNLVGLYELFAEDEQWYFTMEYVEGKDLLSYVGASSQSHAQARSGVRERAYRLDDSRQPRRPPDYDRLRACLLSLARALAHVHALGKLHCDVKPSNVLVTAEGRVVLLDFGIAADLRDGGENDESEGPRGTPAYMAPEQAALEPLTPAADWYGLGSVLYEALTGLHPFAGDGIEQITAKMKAEPGRARTIDPAVPEDLDELCAALLRTDPSDRPGGAAVLAALAPRVSRSSMHPLPLHAAAAPTMLVGRERELLQLGAAFERTRNGESAIAFVEAISGMGKSAFVEGFLGALKEGRRAFVLEGRCFERESVPYKALDGIVDALTRWMIDLSPEEQARFVPRDAAALTRIFPAFDRVQAIGEAPRRAGEGFDPHQLRRRAFSALREMLTRLSADAPLVLFIDDLQWSDLDSVALLRELAAPPDAPRVLFVLAYRAEDVAKSPALKLLLDPVAGLGSTATRIALGPLALEDARRIADAMLVARGQPSAAMVEAIAREAGGSPFFIGQLAEYVVDRRVTNLHELRIDTVVRERVGALDPEPHTLLEVVATAGRPVRQSVAFRASGLRGEVALGALSMLRTASLVRAVGASGDEVLECFHDRIRETTTASLDSVRLKAHHALLARTLAESGNADPEALFVHYRGAGEPARAAEHAIVAARRTAQALAFDRAAALFHGALAILPQEDDRRHALRIELGDALTNAGRGVEAAEAYLAGGPTAPNEGERIWLKTRAAEELLFAGHVERGKEEFSFVLAVRKMKFARERWRAIVRILLLRLWLTIRGLSFTPRASSAIPPDELVRLDLLVSVATGLVMVDTIIGAPFAIGNVVEALRVGEPWRVCRALVVETCFLCTAGIPSRKKVDRYLAKASEVARMVNRVDTDALVTATHGTAHYFRGEWRAARDLLMRGLVAYEEFVQPMAAARTMTGYNFSARWEMGTFRYFALVSLTHLGELGELGARLLPFLRDAEDRGDLSAVTNFRVGEPNFHWIAKDEPDFVETMVDDAMMRWPNDTYLRQHWLALLARTQLDLYRGKTQGLLDRIDGDWPRLTRSLLMRIQYFKLRALHMRARALLACSGRGAALVPERVARAERDAQVILRAAAPWAAPLAHLVLAAAARQRGDDDTSRVLARRAVHGLDAAGMILSAGAARVRLGAIEGGDGGRALVVAGTSALRAAGVVDDVRMARMLAPGFD
jgi:tRNA A-37 threonylcarbamoyl transferase component Bud32